MDTPRNSRSQPDPTTKPPNVTVILPCLNESAGVTSCVRALRAELDRLGYEGEVLVVDGGSTDGSPDLARDAGARVVTQPIPGYGAACIRGIEEALGDYLVFMDADGTYDPAVLARFIEPLRVGIDLVVGTRRNGMIHPGAVAGHHLHILEPVQNHLFRRWFKFRASDVRCGVRSLRKDVAQRLGVQATGMEFGPELLSCAVRAGLSITEVPVTFGSRPTGDSRRRTADGWRVVRQMLLVSPTRFFMVPGAIMTLVGLIGLLGLFGGPLQLGAIRFDYHFMFGASAIALFGLQLVLLGLYAQTFALLRHPSSGPDWVVRFHLLFTMERGLFLGGILLLTGLGIAAWIVMTWIAAGRGDLFAVRPAVAALTLMVSGAEIAFASVFLSFLRQHAFGRV